MGFRGKGGKWVKGLTKEVQNMDDLLSEFQKGMEQT